MKHRSKKRTALRQSLAQRHIRQERLRVRLYQYQVDLSLQDPEVRADIERQVQRTWEVLQTLFE